MAKMKKYPKTPSAKASMETLKKYEDACKKVAAYNAGIEKEKKQKSDLLGRVKKMKSK